MAALCPMKVLSTQKLSLSSTTSESSVTSDRTCSNEHAFEDGGKWTEPVPAPNTAVRVATVHVVLFCSTLGFVTTTITRARPNLGRTRGACSGSHRDEA
eukprot:124923-Rhodomonas_salina.1